jgi:hypothetical protein
MDAIRARVGSVFEWVIAAVFLLATLAVGTLIVQELRRAPIEPPAAAAESTNEEIPPSVPARAISVPMLLLFDGRQIRLGDTIEAIAAALGRGAETGAQQVDRGPLGERITRFYEHAGTRFILVFQRAPKAAESKVAAIFIQ